VKPNLVQDGGVADRKKTKMLTVFWWGHKLGDVRLEDWGDVFEGESEGNMFLRLVVSENVSESGPMAAVLFSSRVRLI
jgi:hypothetical protein